MAANGGASSLLTNLPSRGLFSSSVLSSDLGGTRVYVCTHDTSPPEDQIIAMDASNILIRSLMISKQKNESMDASKDKNKGKRSGKALVERTPSKRAKNTSSSLDRQGESASGFSGMTLQAMTVQRLRSLLKERRLPTRGRKDELITRLRDALNDVAVAER